MARALDHLVLATRDLAGLKARFEALGFTVGGRNRHPWGTENHIVQFRSTFLELIGFAADYRPLPPSDEAYPFAGFLERYLARHAAGLAMAVLRSSDARADAARFARDGLGTGRLLPFSRTARGPDGSDRTVAFTIAFAHAPSMPNIGFFTCEQHRPENFWNPALQAHPNGAEEMTGFDIATAAPEDRAPFLAGFADQAKWTRIPGGIAIALDGGQLTVVSAPSRLAARIDGVEVRLGQASPAGDGIDNASGRGPAPGETFRIGAGDDGFTLRLAGGSERREGGPNGRDRSRP